MGAAVEGAATAAARHEPAWSALRNRVRTDRTLLVGSVMIIADLVWRAVLASGGFLAVDDYVLAPRAARSELSLHFLLTPYNNHLQPGGNLIYWALTRWVGLQYWPYLVLILVGQAAAAIVFFRLMRRLTGPGWVAIVSLAIFSFSPLTLEATTWVPAAIYLVPMQLATVWALSAHVQYVRTRAPRHLVSLGLALGFGLFFYEKTLLISVILLLVTACLYASGGPLRSLWQALRTWWQSWAVVAGISLVYLAVYVSHSTSGNTVRRPQSTEVAVDYLGQIVGRTLIPGLVGGPVRWWTTGQGTALVDPPAVVTWLGCLVLAALVVVTIARRPAWATRAWLVSLLYAPIPIAMIAMTRLDSTLSDLIGLLPHYVYDVIVLVAISVGVAIAGRPGQDEPARPLPAWATSRPAVGLAGATAVAALVAAVVSGIGYGRALAQNPAHDYLRTVHADLAQASPDAVFVDRFVPEFLVWRVHPTQDRLVSGLLAADKLRPTFGTQGEGLFVVDDDGHVRPATVAGRSALPGPSSCGWPGESGATTTVPLGGDPTQPAWALRIAYDSTAGGTATVRFGDVTRDIPVRQGTHEYLVILDVPGGPGLTGGQVDVTLHAEGASLCAGELEVGEVVAGQ